LTVLQFALALMLLVGAGLLVQSYRRVQEVDVGFDPQGVVAFRVVPPSPRYDSAPAVAALYDRLISAVRSVGGVSAAAVVNHAPLGNGGIPTQVRVPGRVVDSTGSDAALYKTVSADYREVMDIPVIAGRWFTENDMTSAATGVVISKTMADRFWPGASAIGQSLTIFKSSQVRPDFGAPVNAQVIGVVGDVLHFGMETQALNEVYVPYTSEPWPHSVLLVRTNRPSASVIPELRRAILSVDRDIPVSGSGRGAGIQPLVRNIDTLLATRSWMMTMVIAFAASALLLAALGIYGVTAFLVAQRTHELGVRVALGASRRQILSLVLRRGVVHALLGVVLGLTGAFALTRLMSSLLFGTSPTEPLIFVMGPMVLTLVAIVACYLPARRASGVDPVVALRAE
jgi:putative ABC transport system permease protein